MGKLSVSIWRVVLQFFWVIVYVSSERMVLTRTDLDDIKKVVVNEVRAIFISQLKYELVTAISQEIEKRFQMKFLELQNQVETTKSQLLSLQQENEKLKKAFDSNEQYLRSRNIRIMGMQVSQNENLTRSVLDLFNKQMNISTINSDDITKCHRVSSKNQSPDKPPVVLVEFTNINKRSEVLKSRKTLKNTNITIKEDLTKFRLNLLNAAVTKFSAKNAWCLHGNIYVRSAGVVHRVESEGDVRHLRA